MKLGKIGFFAALAIAGAAEIVWLKQHNARLRAEVAEWRARNWELAPVREENLRWRAAAVRAEMPPETAVEENRPPPRETGGERRAAGTAANRDPEKGLVALENFRNVGRASPGAAFQTAIWAIVKGDDDTLAHALALTDTARKKADTLLADLPDPVRAKYASPEKLVGVFFSAGVLIGADGFQIVGQDYDDTSHATVRLRTSDGKDDTFSMQLGPSGWQMVVGERDINAIEYVLKHPTGSQNTSGPNGASNAP
jgi:hypothetical protein